MDGDLTIEEMLRILGDTGRRMRHQDTFEALAALETIFSSGVYLTASIEAA